MSGETPNLGLQYLDPSQAQPEVKLNDAWDKIDASAIGGVAVSDLSSPPIVTRVRELKFMGATVTHETGDVALIQIDSSSGGGGSGGSPLTVTDGSTSVANVTEIHFTNAAVADAGGGISTVHADTTSGGGGGGNVTPDTHPDSPDATDDEFEELTLDGSWTQRNFTGTATVTIDKGSVCIQTDTSSGANNHAITKPLAAPSSAWAYDFDRLFFFGGSSSGPSIGAIVKCGTKYIKFGFYWNSGVATILVQRLTTLTAEDSNPLASGTVPLQALVAGETIPLYLRLTYDGSTNLKYYLSMSGHEGTFALIFTEAIATFLGGAATDIGLVANAAVGAVLKLYCDGMRRIA